MNTLVIILFAILVTSTFAKSTSSRAILQLPQADDSENEIDVGSEADHKPEREIQLALMTNELRPSVDVESTRGNTAHKTQVEQVQQKADAPAAPNSAQFIDLSKPPSSTMGFFMELFTSLCSWIYNWLIN